MTLRVPAPRTRQRLCGLLLGLSTCLGGCSGDAPPPRPNVILFTLDTTRADYIGAYGLRSIQTPNFDALARDGVRFDLALSSSAVTPVSHATILTGQYPYTHGVRVLSGGTGAKLRADQETLASAFKRAGYHTAAVHSAFPVSSYFGFDRDFDVFESLESEMVEQGNEGQMGWNTTEFQRRSDATNAIVTDFLAHAEEPFFLWVHYWDPHDPLLLPPEPFLQGIEPNAQGAFEASDEVYAREVHYLDLQFGDLMKALQEGGQYENSIIALTADHGEGLSDGMERHQWWAHRMLYQEQIHVPLLLRLPGGPRDVVVPQVVGTVDVAPTLLDYAGVPAGATPDGRSLRPLIDGEETAPRFLYADQVNGYDTNAKMVERRPDARFLYALIDDDGWKLVYRPHMPGNSELYDLRNDPLELHNLFSFDSGRAQAMLSELGRRNPWVLAPFAPVEGSTASDALESLGYAAGAVQHIDWAWTCPKHMDVREPERSRHDGCGEILIPVARD